MIKKLFLPYIFIQLPVVFFLNGVFWDDWVLFNTENQHIYQRFEQAGSMLNLTAFYHIFMMGALGPWSYKVLTATIFLLNGYLFTRILRSHNVDNFTCWAVLAIYISIPMFTSRYVAINTPYLIGPMLFMLGWLSISKNTAKAAILFFLSFSIQSLLVVYLVPFALYIWQLGNIRAIFRNSFKIIVLGFLPFIFYYLKLKYFEPSGVYSGYNTLAFENILPSIKRLPEVTNFAVRQAALSSGKSDYIVGVIVFLGLFKVTKNIIDNADDAGPSSFGPKTTLVVFMAAVGLVLSIFPYAVVGNELNFYYGFESRNQALAIFPLSVILGLLLRALIKKFGSGGVVIACLVLVSFTMIQMLIYQAYTNDWSKTKKIVTALGKVELDLVHNIVLNDQIGVPFAENRKLHDYEWSGILRYAASRDGFFARDEEYWNGGVCYADYATSPLYNTQDYERRLNNDVTRIILESEDGYDVPLLGLTGYQVKASVVRNLGWCNDVCGDCGFE